MGTQHLRVPYGLLRQLCYPGGQRLAPRVTKIRPPEPEADAAHIPYVYVPNANAAPTIHRPVMSVNSRIVSPENAPTLVVSINGERMDRMGNLSNEAYKFFKGSVIAASHYFQCRGCLMEEYVSERKAAHMRTCRPLMQAIEERIKRDKVCVVCNQNTPRDRWKIPLCSEVCVTKFRFSMPDCWQIARRFVLAADPNLMRMKCESTRTNS